MQDPASWTLSTAFSSNGGKNDLTAIGTVGRIKRLNQRLTRGMEKGWLAHGLKGASFDVLATLHRAGAPYALRREI